jgi:N-acyl-D-amino-acid deacylase
VAITSPLAENFIHMGVTSIVAGNCGSSALAVGDALTAIRESRRGCQLRDARRSQHRAQLRDGQRSAGSDARGARADESAGVQGDGRWRRGFSTGLQYIPGTYSKANEIIELARVAANERGIYATHMRNEGTELEAAVAESIRVARSLDMPLEISHLKVDSPSRWGASVAALKLIDDARAAGVRVQADQYAYTAGSSSLTDSTSPALEGGTRTSASGPTDEETWAKVRERDAGISGRARFQRPVVGCCRAIAPTARDERAVDERGREKMVGDGTPDAQLRGCASNDDCGAARRWFIT